MWESRAVSVGIVVQKRHECFFNRLRFGGGGVSIQVLPCAAFLHSARVISKPNVFLSSTSLATVKPSDSHRHKAPLKNGVGET